MGQTTWQLPHGNRELHWGEGDYKVSWWSMRAVYLHSHENGGRLYEERIVLFRADTVESAFELAERDSQHYLQLNPEFQRVSEWIAFAVHGADDLSGVEIWSGLSRSDLAPTDYYEARYGRFELAPDAEDAADQPSSQKRL